MQLFAVAQEHLSRRGLLFICYLYTADDPRDLVSSVVAGDLSYHALAPTVYFDFFYQKMMIGDRSDLRRVRNTDDLRSL